MRIGTAEPNSTFLRQGQALKTLLERHNINGPVEVLTALSASTENAARLHEGDLDFGFMASNWIGRAARGETPFDFPIDLRMVAPANAGPLFFIVPADSDIQDVRDLKGKRVCTGAKNSGMTQHAHTILDALGIGFDNIEPVYLHFADGSEALARGEVDAQLQCPIPNPVMTGLDERIDLRVVPYSPADLASLMDKVSFYRPVTMPKGALRALKEDTPQPAVVNVFVTHARADPALVKEIARAMYEGADELAKLEDLYRGSRELFEPMREQGARALEFGGVKLHEGAAAAYASLGLLS